MKFNWIFTKKADQRQKIRCIDLEYQLRPRITRFLLEQFDSEESFEENFSRFHFDVYVETEMVYMGEDTPDNYLRRMASQFDLIFNGNQRLTVA